MENNYFIALGNSKDEDIVEDYKYIMQFIGNVNFISVIEGMEIANVSIPYKSSLMLIPIITDSEINNYELVKKDKKYDNVKQFPDDVIYKHSISASNVPQLTVNIPPQSSPISFNTIVILKRNSLGEFKIQNVMKINDETVTNAKSLQVTVDIFSDKNVVIEE